MRAKKYREDGQRNFDGRELQDIILTDKYNRIVFQEGRGLSLYLVGGHIRDALMGKDSLDRDFVAGGDYWPLLQRVATITGGRLVRIGDVLCRIVLKDNSTLDFTPLMRNIYFDLSKRDFTINSIAWSPTAGIVDPHGGIADLGRRTIKMIGRDNLAQDPVRLLRAYRIASELSFRIDPGTSRAIGELSGLITNSKSERITLEFFKILNGNTSPKVLHRMLNNGLLSQLIPFSIAELQCKLRVLSRVERLFNVLPLKYMDMVDHKCSQNLCGRGLIRLEILLNGAASAGRLILGRKISRRIRLVSEGERIILAGGWTYRTLFSVFTLLTDTSIDFLVMKGRHDLISEYERYSGILKNGLLSTDDIIRECGLSEGVILGDLIMAVRRAGFEKKINSYMDAVRFVRSRCNII